MTENETEFEAVEKSIPFLLSYLLARRRLRQAIHRNAGGTMFGKIDDTLKELSDALIEAVDESGIKVTFKSFQPNVRPDEPYYKDVNDFKAWLFNELFSSLNDPTYSGPLPKPKTDKGVAKRIDQILAMLL